MVRFSDGLVRSRGSRWSSVCFRLSPRHFAPSGRAAKTGISRTLQANRIVTGGSGAFRSFSESARDGRPTNFSVEKRSQIGARH